MAGPMPSLPAVDALYPELTPYRVHALPVSQGHVLHLEESGRPDGLPAVVLHGGPGSGSSPLLKRFFDPARYRVITVDQRGAGRSQPRGCTLHNTTAHLIEDLQAVRAHLGIDTWLVVGGSWGATLALAYAAEHPQAVAALLLRAVFLARPDDIEGFFQRPPPEHAAAWARFAGVAPADQRHALLPFLAHGLAHGLAQAATQGDTDTARRLALAWWRWESSLATLASSSVSAANPDPSGPALDALLDRYRVQSHYLVHRCWLDTPPLLQRCGTLPHVPTLLLHSRDDAICRPEAALALHRCVPHSLLRWVDGAGHDPSHPAMASAMVGALGHYATHGHFS